MANKSIPEVGEIFKGYIPGIKKIAHVTFGVASANPDVEVSATGVYDLVDITVPVVIFGMWTQIEEAFTAAVTSGLGDSSAAELYSAAATIADTATGAILVAATGLSVPLVKSDLLDVEVTIGGTAALAGLAHVYIEYAELHD